ncbi:MAG: hypothetical protein H5T86_04100 [Armatimonadetes bacterium]|nr:hypothetical protein [Armatimonadota bacterium]
MRPVQVVCVMALLAAGYSLAQEAAQPQVPRPPLGIWEVSSVFYVLQRLIDAGVTPQDLKPAAGALQEYAQADEAYYQATRDPTVVAAWQQIIEKVIAGQTPTEEDMAKVRQGENLDKLGRARQDAIQKAAAALANCLQDYQLAEIGSSEKRRVARDIVRQLAERRGAPPEQWKEWAEQRAADLAKRFGPDQTEKMAQELAAFFQQVRNMPTDDFYARTAQLVDQLTVILGKGQPEPREEQLGRAQQWFREILEGPWHTQALLRWIQQGVAPGTAAAAQGQ